MIKNITIAVLCLGYITVLFWPQKSLVRDKPEVKIYLPNGYCGKFVVFWDKNTSPVEDPPEFLSYNYYPEINQDGVIITLPEPYARAELQFLYDTRAVENTLNSLNPVFRLISVGTTGFGVRREVLDDGSVRTSSDPELDVDRDVFFIEPLGECLLQSGLDIYQMTKNYLDLKGIEFQVIDQ